jgi:membrane protein implicated in regulation of membrane protease activity
MIYILTWLVVGFFFLLLELINPGLFFFISFFCGSLIAALLSWYTFTVVQQTIAFFAASCTSFLLICLVLKKRHYLSNRHVPKTNFFALIGKHAKVIEEIKPGQTGSIKVDGQIWSAKGKENECYPIGSLVEIIDVVGCHCKVRALKENN